ncbi:MAG: hypothetical protein ACE5EO_08045 [Candidatus Krumholzibacteriia bacterium]
MSSRTLVSMFVFFFLGVFVTAAGAKGPPVGNCPDIYYESDKTLSNNAVVVWTSSFGGFEYSAGGSYTVTVSWTVTGASSVSYEGFDEKRKAWTPRGSAGGWSVDDSNASNGSIDLTVTMSDMHRSVKPNWAGYIANGHFKLQLDVDGIRAKLGVNIHLEDPDTATTSRCKNAAAHKSFEMQF